MPSFSWDKCLDTVLPIHPNWMIAIHSADEQMNVKRLRKCEAKCDPAIPSMCIRDLQAAAEMWIRVRIRGGMEAWMKAMPRCWTQDDIQSLSQGSLYLQSNPYLIIMHNSHFQTENCIEGALRKSKTASVRELMVVIIALSKKEFRNTQRLERARTGYPGSFRHLFRERSRVKEADARLASAPV